MQRRVETEGSRGIGGHGTRERVSDRTDVRPTDAPGSSNDIAYFKGGSGAWSRTPRVARSAQPQGTSVLIGRIQRRTQLEYADFRSRVFLAPVNTEMATRGSFGLEAKYEGIGENAALRKHIGAECWHAHARIRGRSHSTLGYHRQPAGQRDGGPEDMTSRRVLDYAKNGESLLLTARHIGTFETSKKIRGNDRRLGGRSLTRGQRPGGIRRYARRREFIRLGCFAGFLWAARSKVSVEIRRARIFP